MQGEFEKVSKLTSIRQIRLSYDYVMTVFIIDLLVLGIGVL
jgi:hypothetical protein